jgi:hypothetical protein
MSQTLVAPGERYAESALDIINQSSILTEKDLSVITELKEELAETFLRSQIWRTRTEMEVSVLNDMNFPTPDAKYWQCQREQNVHFQELVMLSYEYRKNLVEIRKLEKKMAAESDLDDKELLEIDIERKKFISRTHERFAQDRIREIKEWHEIKEGLIPNLEHGMVDCGEHQLVSYTRRWIMQYLNMGNAGSPGERQNLVSQLEMGLRACSSKGLLKEIMEELTPPIRALLSNQFGLSANGRLKG